MDVSRIQGVILRGGGPIRVGVGSLTARAHIRAFVVTGAPDSPMMRERERARRIATTIVSFALGIVGLTLVALAVALALQGGGLIILAFVVGGLGLVLGAAGFFFQLVPLRLDELAEEKRAYDRRERE